MAGRNWDKVRVQERMRHPDETLHDGYVKPDRGTGTVKKAKPKKVDDRREKPAGADALLAKMAKKQTPTKARVGQKATASRASKVTVTKRATKVRTSGSRSVSTMANPSRGRTRTPRPAPDPGEAAAVIGSFLEVLRREEMSAPQGVIDRLEGAFLALTALADGRCPSPAELLGDHDS